MSKAENNVWKWGDPAAPGFPEHFYDIAKSAAFQDPAQPEPDEDVQFRLLELHVVQPEKTLGDDEGNDAWSKYPCRVFTHTGMLSEMKDENCGTKKCHYAESIDEALAIYAKIYSTFSKFHKTKKFLSRWVGSQVYRNQALESGLRDGPAISDEVARLMEYVWRETIGELQELLKVSYRKIGLGRVEKAEGVLLQIRKNLEKNSEEDDNEEKLFNLNREFYELIPYRPRYQDFISHKRIIATKQELCQLIKDIVNVSESTDWSQRSSSQARYHAIQCFISYLPPNHPEFVKIKAFLMETKSSEEPLDIKRIFAATRGIEEASFDGTIGNNQLLLHGSRPATFLGILARGLLLPKIVVEEYGGSRRDAGLLGQGIYFADRVSTVHQYSPPSQQACTRLMVINKVALGNVKELYKFDMTLNQAPEGHHSTHGVSSRSAHPIESEFEDDEFVVYETIQQCMRYLVEFTLPGETEVEIPLCETPQIAEGPEEMIIFKQVEEVQSSAPTTIDLSDVECAKDPIAGVDAGLVSQNETSDSITLQAVHVRAKLLDLVAEVVVLQSYRNNSDETMEAKYVFPLDQSAAVCGFEAFINDKHVVGVVKEKEKAHREYRQAVEAGHGAYLMDEEFPHVFSVSVGNLPPQADVLIKVTYVTELSVEGDRLAFNLLGTVAPWKRQEVLAKGTPSERDVVDVELETIYKEQSIHVAVTMASKITSIESSTHSILVKQSDNKASIKLGKDSKLDEGFQLLIGIEEIHKPRVWIEEPEPGSDDQAAMLVFYPELDVSNLANPEMVLVMDSSNSMKGSSLEEAKKILLLIVKNLPSSCTFNVVVFGTEFDELFPASQQKSRKTVKSAKEFIKGYSVGGGTDFWRPLQSQNLLKQEHAHRNLFLVTDGHLNNEEATLRAVGRNRAFTRIFTCGVSATANRHLLAAVARQGGGAFEFFDSAAKSTWEKKIKLQVSRASQPAVTSVSVQWDQDSQETLPLLQAPAQITSLFRKNRLIVYGLLRNFAKATLFAEVNGKKVETVLSAIDQPHTEGNIIHKLAAHAVIRDWEEGVLHADRPEHEAQKHELKSRIVELSIRHSIVTPMTSFIAVEEREEEEQRHLAEGQKLELLQTVEDLLSSEDVDQLPTLNWEEPSVAKHPEISPSNLVNKLLQTAIAAADSYSFKTAEKYFSKAYKVAKEKLSHTQPLTLKVAHRFSKFCARVEPDMRQAFDLVNDASEEVKKHLPAEVLETTLSEDFSNVDELDSLQQAVEWAETCKIEMERQQDQPMSKARRLVPSIPFSPQISQEDDDESMLTIEVLPERRQAIEIEIPASPEFDQLVMMEDFPVVLQEEWRPEPKELDLLPSVVVRKKEVHYEPAVETPKRKPKNVFTKLALRLKKSIRRKSLELREEELSLEDTLDETEIEMIRPTGLAMHRDTCTLDDEPIALLTEGITRPPLPRREHHYPRALSEPFLPPHPPLPGELTYPPAQSVSAPLPHPHPLPGESYPPAQSAPAPPPPPPHPPLPGAPAQYVPAPPPHPPLPGAPAQYVPASPPPRSLGSLPRSLPAVPLTGVSWDRLQSEEERSRAPWESLKMAAEIGMADMGMDGMGMDDMAMCALSIDQPRGMSTNTERLLSMQGQNGSWVFFPGFEEILVVQHIDSRRLIKEKLESELLSHGVVLDVEGVIDKIFQLLATIMAKSHIVTRLLVHPTNPGDTDQKKLSDSVMKAKEFIKVSQMEIQAILGFELDWELMGAKLVLFGKME
ncbi:protein mono-ADP-ribosyltransferase PARP4-like [Asterias amurensis]|uniref:protein mono-ADP-ribosyltransferase PARP4-like n=1 Tax=Asterias amurensis TaxID=7602 RepID=UPI003AB189C5